MMAHPRMNKTFNEKKPMSKRKKFFLMLISLFILAPIVSACSLATSNPTQKAVPQPTAVPTTPTPTVSAFCPIVGTDYWDRLGFDFRLVQTDKGGQNILLVTKGQNDVQLTSNPMDYESSPRLSPDNRTVVFARKSVLADGRITDQNLWVMTLDGYNQRQLTSTPGWDYSYPFFSSDGSLIYFVRNPVGSPEYGDLYVMWVDGTSITRLTLHREVWEPILVDNGRKVAFHSGQANSKFFLGLDGSGLTDITPGCP